MHDGEAAHRTGAEDEQRDTGDQGGDVESRMVPNARS